MAIQKAHPTKKALIVSGLALCFSGLVACSTTSERDYMVENSEGDEYVYIVDYEKMALIEGANRESHSNLETVWVNPPVKRIKRSELEQMQKQ